MPKPMHRSRSFRRLDRVPPNGKHVIHYARRRGSLPKCSICSKELNGLKTDQLNRPKTQKTNARIFGGVLCSRCTSEVVKLASRIENGEMKLNDISIRQRNYILQMTSH